MAVLFACMVTAVELTTTDKGTAELGFTAAELFAELAAEALLHRWHLARVAGPSVACLFAPVDPAI